MPFLKQVSNRVESGVEERDAEWQKHTESGG